MPALAVALFLPNRRTEAEAARIERLREVPLARALAASEPQEVEALAAVHDAPPRATERLLRHLAEGGLAERHADGRWSGTAKLRAYVETPAGP